MKIQYTLVLFALFILNCKNANTPNYDFGNYTYSTTGVRNDQNGTLLVKTMATGKNYEEVKKNALRKTLLDVMLKGITNGCSDCKKDPLFLNRQNDPKTKYFVQNFFENKDVLEKYATITTELATWEQKRDLKYTQNQPFGFEVLVKYEDLKHLIKTSVLYEN
ncbi:hypothetical protein SAMN05421789_101248 [Kaistella chaponensis]|uniref:Lipoprotein n=1 Tax=Kaistella chaponensis TaxID=713588 RepID=A0A1N7J8R5_9FLAO|nr:hypothetical protein [Kaistella chaponensis]SIS45651.1 hypothetical protein SAMN05421789_101248 [Kaistella chaponensis]